MLEDRALASLAAQVGPQPVTASGPPVEPPFRTTKIRDADGRIHVIRNGDMKPVINYSNETFDRQAAGAPRKTLIGEPQVIQKRGSR